MPGSRRVITRSAYRNTSVECDSYRKSDVIDVDIIFPMSDKIGGQNLFVQVLSEAALSPSPEKDSTKFVVEDNVGESIHIHYRNLRIDHSVDDFLRLAKHVRDAKNKLEYGDC